MKRVLLGLGSNKNFQNMSSEKVLKMVCNDLASFFENPVFSSVYKTRAMYVQNQQDFYNMVALGYISDDYSPFELLEKIHEIEAKYGRDRSKEIRFGPRSLDIDIELFGDLQINDEILQIPHPRIQERAFVLIPALEILNDSADVKERIAFEEYLSKIDLSSDENRVEKVCFSDFN